MTKSIMAPIDLAHTDALETAVAEAAALAKSKGANLTLVGVTGSAASEAAHNPAEFDAKLAGYADGVANRFGLDVEHLTLQDNDVTVDLANVLIEAGEKIGADIIVRAAVSDEFAAVTGTYFDNDSGRFSEPHPDALEPEKCDHIVQTIEALLDKAGHSVKS